MPPDLLVLWGRATRTFGGELSGERHAANPVEAILLNVASDNH